MDKVTISAACVLKNVCLLLGAATIKLATLYGAEETPLDWSKTIATDSSKSIVCNLMFTSLNSMGFTSHDGLGLL